MDEEIYAGNTHARAHTRPGARDACPGVHKRVYLCSIKGHDAAQHNELLNSRARALSLCLTLDFRIAYKPTRVALTHSLIFLGLLFFATAHPHDQLGLGLYFKIAIPPRHVKNDGQVRG